MWKKAGTFSHKFFDVFISIIIWFVLSHSELICTCEFFKSSLVQINSKLNSKPYDYPVLIHKGHCASLRIGNLHLNLQIKSQNKLLRNMLCKLSRKFLGLLELQLEVDNRELVVHFEHKSIQQHSWRYFAAFSTTTL